MKQKEKELGKKLEKLRRELEKKNPPIKPDAFGRRKVTPEEVRKVIRPVVK